MFFVKVCGQQHKSANYSVPKTNRQFPTKRPHLPNLNYRSHKDKFSLIKAWIVHLREFMMIVGLGQCNEWFNTSLSTDEKNCHIIFRKLGKFCNTILARTVVQGRRKLKTLVGTSLCGGSNLLPLPQNMEQGFCIHQKLMGTSPYVPIRSGGPGQQYLNEGNSSSRVVDAMESTYL